MSALNRRPGFIVLAPILWGLLVSKGSAAEPLQDALTQMKSTDVIKRRIAAQELVNLRNPDSVPALLQALSDKDTYVRTLAVRALGYMHWTAAEPRLEEVLAGDKDPQVRETAGLSLRFLNDPNTIPALCKALKDPAEQVRLTAILSLAYYKNASSTPALIEVINDKSSAVRRTALFALGQIADPAAVPALKSGLKDTDSLVRANAAQALGKTPGKEGLVELKETLKDPDPLVQISAAWALAMHGDRSGNEIAAGAAKSSQHEIQLLATETIKMIKDKQP